MNLLNKQPENTLLFNTFSDPPTVTMQRIKTLTTGNLPSFVDIYNAFHHAQVHDDNLLS